MADINTKDLTQALDDLAYSNAVDNVKRRGSSDLGKDEFLQLLVCQMQNQDPLNPQDDSDFIAQLAQFSSLEQMTNLNTTVSNTSAYGLVGKEVIVQKADASGNTTEVRGTVDSVIMKNGDAMLSIDGSMYSIDDLVEVMNDAYAALQYAPKVAETELKFNLQKPTLSTVEIDLGSNGYEAGSVAVSINGQYIDKEKMSYADGKLSIVPSAFEGMTPGTYNLVFDFDDVYQTRVADKVKLIVTNGADDE